MNFYREANIYIGLGIIGALLILFGFYRTSIGKWSGKSLWYELDNFFGAVLLTIYQWHYKIYISVILNIIWAIVAFRGLEPYAKRRLNGKSNKRKR
jgi:hypothetical protein